MSANPFNNLMASRAASRAAFDAGQRETDVVNNLNFNDISGQPPLSQSREQNLSLKVKAPPLTPLTLDLGAGSSYGSGSSEVNSVGILKSYAGIFGRNGQSESTAFNGSNQESVTVPENAVFKTSALKTDATTDARYPQTLTFAPEANAQATGFKPAEATSFKPTEAVAQNSETTTETALPKRSSPALSVAEFGAIQKAYGDKFANATYDLSIKHTDSGSVFRHKYTADDFSTCTLSSKDGAISAVVTDRYARPALQEDIGADGRSTVTRYAYDDSTRKAMFASSKEVTSPDGTVKTYNYDRFGKVIQA